MKKSVMLLAAMLIATSAFAVVDPDTDMLGLYFDTTADVVCTTAAPLAHVPAYVIYTNPSLTSIRGFECKVSYVAGDNNTSISATFPTSTTDVGNKTAPNFNFIAGFANPLPTSEATVLAILDIFYLNFSGSPMDFYVGAAVPSSSELGLPMVLRSDFSEMNIGTSTEGGLAAQLNGACGVVENEDASFGAVKALFR
ncbi:MAG: hypothetical protein AB7V45_17170 [Candidatus Krumholzibacteriia bacterium]